MLRLIFKNLWARRRRNGWLLAELILVSVITWVIADPLVVMTHDRLLPEGFQTEGLYLIGLDELPSVSPLYHAEESDSFRSVAHFERILQRIRSYAGVVSATSTIENLMPYSSSNSSYRLRLDSTQVTSFVISFVEKSDFFQTLGLKGAEGMTAAQLDEMTFEPNTFVLTANADGGTPLLRRSAVDRDSLLTRVVGVVQPFRMISCMQPVPVSLYPVKAVKVEQIPGDVAILFRVREGISMNAFLSEFRPWMVKELKSGNLFATSVQPYSVIRSKHEFNYGVTNKYRLNLVLGWFFLVNLCLGVAGTLWMQTRSRCEEVGVMLSFGANSRYILCMLMGESWVLTTSATLIGCLGYLNFALKDGLFTNAWNPNELSSEYLINSLGWHFLGVSLLVWFILLLVVTIGVYIPARRLAAIHPVEALRAE